MADRGGASLPGRPGEAVVRAVGAAVAGGAACLFAVCVWVGPLGTI
jgi:hypothetical protein